MFLANVSCRTYVVSYLQKAHYSLFYPREELFSLIFHQNLTTKSSPIITINGRGLYTAPCVMCLRRANPLRGAFEGLGPKSRDFFGP